ncbi:ABC transporter ATP-binding protein [Microbacterium sp. MPKO10]|uniref:ABC transporter ATP-binding protein n=1 Tax=Microbacterium sp. MPKO10 TaxID=2989818 RepID=UPI002236A280|nr:ABC transporter ATP-binding protein [Microbacterium sp. MPKO10]MCW4457981.1 ABC transporter ATP-binding protein [Microbacterium sp. MPKO10]
MTTVIDIDRLTKRYGTHRGIDDVSFAVEESEIFGFIGPNGAGKSTTIRALLALIRPTSGTARIFGRDCIRDAPEIARHVGYIPSETFFYDGMRVRDLLAYTARLYGVDASDRIAELASRMKLDTTRKIRDLSLGNKKKVGIVAALLHSPRLLILDEPTSGLDPLMQRTLFEILDEENNRGVTILFSSHVLSEVQAMCDRVAILKEGRVLEIQSIDDLRKRSFKHVRVRTTTPIPEHALNIEGVSDLSHADAWTSFIYHGDFTRMFDVVHGLHPEDVLISEPSLDEIFLHYYQ